MSSREQVAHRGEANIVSKIFVLSSRFSCSKDLLNCVVEKNDRVSK